MTVENNTHMTALSLIVNIRENTNALRGSLLTQSFENRRMTAYEFALHRTRFHLAEMKKGQFHALLLALRPPVAVKD